MKGTPTAAPPFVFMEAGDEKPTQLVIRSGRWKLIQVRSSKDRRAMNNKEVELYDVHADPGEQHDLARKESAIVEKLAARLASWAGSTPSGSGSMPIVLGDLDVQEQAMLRALGYLE